MKTMHMGMMHRDFTVPINEGGWGRETMKYGKQHLYRIFLLSH
jgi:hypothetical protein